MHCQVKPSQFNIYITFHNGNCFNTVLSVIFSLKWTLVLHYKLWAFLHEHIQCEQPLFLFIYFIILLQIDQCIQANNPHWLWATLEVYPQKPYKVVCLLLQHEVDVEYPLSVFHRLSFSTQIPLLKSTVVIIRCVLIRVGLAVTVGFQEKPDPAERGSVEAKTSCCRTAPLIRCLSAWQSDPNPSPVPQLQLHSVHAPLLHCLIGAVTFGTSWRYLKWVLFVMLCFESFLVLFSGVINAI